MNPLTPRTMLLAAVFSVCSACGRDVVEEAPPGPGSGGHLAADLPAFPSDTTTGLSGVNVNCGQRGVRQEATSFDDAKSHLLGVWARCTPAGDGGIDDLTLQFSGAEVLEIRDGSWHKLEAAQDGTLVRRLDINGSGAIQFVDLNIANSAMFLQADFQMPSGGWLLLQPRFEVSPDRVFFSVGGPPVEFIRVR